MKVSAKSVAAMPAYNIKQVTKRNAAVRVLDEAQQLESNFQGKIERIRQLDGTPDDESPVQNVVVTLSDTKKDLDSLEFWAEANFENGGLDIRGETKEMKRDIGYFSAMISRREDNWSVNRQGQVTTYFSSKYSGKKNPSMWFEDNLYEFKKLTVNDVDGDKTYNLTKGSGAHHMIWNGIKSVAASVGGVIGPVLVGLPEVKIKFGSDK